MAAFVDAEHALDAAYAGKLGVDIDNLLVSQPDNGEQALEIVEVLIRSGAVDVLVVDSVAALVPRAEIEGEMGDAQMGLQARLMSQALRKLTGVVSKSKTCLDLHQPAAREDRRHVRQPGNDDRRPGAQVLRVGPHRHPPHRHASRKATRSIGSRAKVKVVKNKVAPPFREAEFDIIYGEGICKEGDLLDLGVEHKVIEKTGAWFAFDGERLGQGRENARQFLQGQPRHPHRGRQPPAQGTRPAGARAHRAPRQGKGRRGPNAGKKEGLTTSAVSRGSRLRIHWRDPRHAEVASRCHREFRVTQ